jgi:hypothetical protein
MRTPLLTALLFPLALGACVRSPELPKHRVDLVRKSGSTFELVPTDGQMPFCLAFTVNLAGVTRQLTMSEQNVSFRCEAGQRVGGHTWRVPLSDGPVKVYVLLTSQAVNAGSVVQQLLEAPDRQHLTVMNMRLPGNAVLETLDFTPEAESVPQEGSVVSLDAGAPMVDAGPTP